MHKYDQCNFQYSHQPTKKHACPFAHKVYGNPVTPSPTKAPDTEGRIRTMKSAKTKTRPKPMQGGKRGLRGTSSVLHASADTATAHQRGPHASEAKGDLVPAPSATEHRVAAIGLNLSSAGQGGMLPNAITGFTVFATYRRAVAARPRRGQLSNRLAVLDQ
jgi:hypothetical protein